MSGLGELQPLASGFAAGPLLVHSDVMTPYRARDREKYKGKKAFLQGQWEVIQQVSQGRPIWSPSFNYDFGKTGLFDIRLSPSHVGVFSEFIRTQHAQWRTEVPFYSIAGSGPLPVFPDQDMHYPFGKHSIFEQLLEQEGNLMFYGGRYLNTFLHYIEQVSNNLNYRYPKRFQGKLITADGTTRQVAAELHCSPLGHHMEYDNKTMLQDLHQEGIATSHTAGNCTIISMQIRPFTDYCLARFKEDPYFMLEAKTRRWVTEKVQQLGRPFCLTDFEPAETTRAAG